MPIGPLHQTSAMPIAFPRRHSDVSDSYPSLPSSESDIDSEDEAAMIQEEWEESLRQLETVLSIVIIPFFGKWYGRRFSYWAFERYHQYGGLTRAFFGLR